VDEQDNVVGHESKYNCKILFCSADLLNLSMCPVNVVWTGLWNSTWFVICMSC